MKELLLRVPNEMVSLFKNLAAYMPEVEIEEVSEELSGNSIPDDTDQRMAMALDAIRHNGAIRYLYDYTWIMVAAGNHAIPSLGAFSSVQSFIDFLCSHGVKHLPSRSAISDWNNKVVGTYPRWTFTDTEDVLEIQRRKNVVRQFINALTTDMPPKLDKTLDKRR